MNIFLKSILAGLAVTVAGYFIVLKKKKQKDTYNATLLLKTKEELTGAKKRDLLESLNERAEFISEKHEMDFYEPDKLKIKLNDVYDTVGLSDLYSGSSRLEIWETYLQSDVSAGLQAADEIFRKQELKKNGLVEKETEDTLTATDLLSNVKEVKEALKNEKVDGLKKYLFYYESNVLPQAVIGYILPADTSIVFPVLRSAEVREHLPDDIKFVLGQPDDNQKENKNRLELYAIKTYNQPDRPFLTDMDIDESIQDYNLDNGKPVINIKFKPYATKIWEKVTERNVNRALAIMVDDDVVVAPVVQTKIVGGNVELACNYYTVSEASTLAYLLDSGRLPTTLSVISNKITRAESPISIKTILPLALCFALSTVAAFMIFRQLKTSENK